MIFWYSVFSYYRFSDLINCLSDMLPTSQIDVGTDRSYRSWNYSKCSYSFLLFYKYTWPFLFLNAVVTFPLILPVSNYPFFLEIFTYYYFFTQKIRYYHLKARRCGFSLPSEDLCITHRILFVWMIFAYTLVESAYGLFLQAMTPVETSK